MFNPFFFQFFLRKLKNREAAQTSRDRKKARMDELEKTVRLLQKSVSFYYPYWITVDSIFLILFLSLQNNELTKEVQSLRCEKDDNQKLRCQIDNLEKENERLKEELRCARLQSTLESTGSAVSDIPLPQGHSSAQTVVLTILLIQTIFLQMIVYRGWKISNLLKTSSKIGFPTTKTRKWVSSHVTSCLPRLVPIILCLNYRNVTKYSTKWWHPHQHSWNPVNQHYLHLVAVT